MKIWWMSIVTLNEVAGCQGDPCSWEVLALLLSTRESLSIFWALNFTSLFQYCPYILLIWEFVWKWKLLKTCLYWPRRFSPLFRVACWFTAFILSWHVYLNWKWRNTLRRGYIPRALCNFNCDVILAAFLVLTHDVF